jgi:manganese/zinc/iron transport system permease protein
MSEVIAHTLELLGGESSFGLRATFGAALVGLTSALLGVFVVLRRLSLIGDAAGHATLPGVAAGFLVSGTKSLPWIYGGALASVAAATLTISLLEGRRRSSTDASIGVSLVFYFGLGILLISYAQSHPSGAQAGLSGFLFGNAAAMTNAQFFTLFGVFVASAAAIVIFWRALEVSSFDPDFCSSIGWNPHLLRVGTMFWIGLVVVVSVQSVGAVLASAMLVIAPSAALNLKLSLKATVVVSAILGALSGLLGGWASFVFSGVGTGPAMVLAAAIIFAFTLALRRFRT